MRAKRVDVAVCSQEAVHTPLVEAAREVMTDEDTLYDLADFFKVLGDSTRVRILSALTRSELCVCDLATLLNMTMSAISHQLKALKQADLVRFRREGKTVFYSLADGHVRDILEKGLEHILEES